MKALKNLEAWGDAHHPKVLDLIRVLLGLFLLLRGIVFLRNYAFLREAIVSSKALDLSPQTVTFLIHYITLVHMIGGVLILLGLVTRLASAVQLPIVFGAVFFVNILNPYFNAELWLSVIVLALLILFVIIGSGPLSIDRALKNLNVYESIPPNGKS